MKFEETSLRGVWMLDLERREDARGFFARTFCDREFADHGLLTRFVQCNLSSNVRRGTLRGMHWQNEPKPEVKLVRCVRGSIYDVVIDLRRDSPTYCRWFGIELSAANGRALYIPAGIAHGFQTLEDNTDVYYHMGEFYEPSLADGVRWNDPAFGVDWPIADPVLSDKDASYADYQPDLPR
jgi:dTDP-4-dehydrorhamnose 3,5-epimerase